jgi:hypothetical protein
MNIHDETSRKFQKFSLKTQNPPKNGIVMAVENWVYNFISIGKKWDCIIPHFGHKPT